MKKYVYLITLFSIISIGLVQGQTTITVTNTNDAGPGSLRAAIAQYIGIGPKTIVFSPSVFNNTANVINLVSPLSIGYFGVDNGTALIVDGSTGLNAGIRVKITYSTASNVVSDNTFIFNTTNIQLKSLEIYGNPVGNGILIQANNNSVTDCMIHSNGNNGVRINGVTGNNLRGNFIGTDGTNNQNLGNKANGIWLENASNNIIGGIGVNEGNIIGNNGYGNVAPAVSTISGLRIETSSNNSIIGNYVGINKNGDILSNNYEGISLLSNSNTNTISNNFIAANGGTGQYIVGSIFDGGGGGLGIRYTSSGNVVKSNTIGFVNGKIVGNQNYGISIEGSNSNIIGGDLVTDANKVYGTKTGPGIIFQNDGNGVESKFNITKNNSFGNVDNTNPLLNNNGVAILVTQKSANNIIGEVGKGNIISNGTNKAIQIDGSSAIGNKIQGNSIFCNTNSKGIELINNGNNNKAASNNSIDLNASTATTLIGKTTANSTIDIYLRDVTCNPSCFSTYANNFNQGKTWVGTTTSDASGNWSWTLTGGATKDNVTVTATDNTNGTSEFSICTSPCIAPVLTPTISANPKTICAGAPAAITIQNGETGVKYVAYLGSTIVSDSGSISTLNLLVNRLNTGINSINVRATASSGCTTVVITDTATIRVNASPNITFNATGGVFCSNATASVTLSGSETGVIYQVFNKTTNTAISNTINGTNNPLPINLNTLIVGTVIAEVRATRANCTTVTLTDTALVVVNTNPSKPSASTTSPLCFGSNAVITVANSQSGVNYQVFEGATAVSTISGGGSANLNLTVTSPSTGAHTYVVRASNVGCSPSNSDNVVVQVNNSPTTSFLVSGGKFCSNPFTASVTLSNSQTGVSYQLLVNGTNTSLSAVVNGTGSGSLNIPLNSTVTSGIYNVQVSASIPGCAPVTLSDTALVTINAEIGNITASALLTELCQGSDAEITFNTKSGVNYQVFENNIAVSTIITGDGNPKSLTVSSPTVGAHTYQIRGTIAGCSSVNSNTVTIQVKSIPINTLTISTDKATICEGGEINITIGNATELGVTYNLFDNGVLIATKTGNGATLPFTQTITGIGNHTFTVTAVNSPCSAVTLLDNESITVNPGLNLNLAVNTTSPLCSDVATTTIKLIAAQANVSYQLFDSTGTTAVGSPVSVSSVQDIEFIVSPVIGINKYLIKATDAGCGTVALNNNATIVVNKKPDSAINVSTNSPLCEGNDVIITLAAENGVTYEAFEGIVSKGTSSLPSNTITISGVGFGLHTYNIIAKIAGCVDVPLTNAAEVTINKQAKSDLSVSPKDTICENTNASIQIFNAEDQVTYQIFKNNQLVNSIKQVGNGNITYNINGLGGDSLFLFTFSAQSPGCTPINLVNSTSLLVYKNPNLSLNFSSTKNEICKGAIVDFTVGANTATNATYTLFEETTLISSQVGNGNSLDFSNITLNTVGTRTFKILVNNKACAADTLNAKVVIKVNEPADKNLGLISTEDTICIGKTVDISASPAQKDVKYVLFDNNVKVDSATATTDNETLSFKNITLITSGNHLFTLTAQRTGCDPVLVNGQVNVYVNKDPKKDIDLSYSGQLCITNPNTLLILRNSERNVLYDVTGSLTKQIKGDGSDISIALTDLPLGISSYQFKATLKGCDIQNLSNGAVIEVRDTVNTNLDLTGMSVCAGDTAIVGIKQSQLGVSYQLTIDKNTYSGLYAGNNNDIFIRITPDKLATGLNIIKVKGFNSPCPAANLKDSTEVYKIQNNYSIQGKSFICEFNVDTLEISPKIPGATSYTWTVPNGVTFTALSADSSIIRVQYGDETTSGTVKVIPHATLGKCDNLSNILNVQVLKPLDGNASILLRDTVCLFDTDTLEFGNIVNVSGYQWSWTDSIQTVDTLKSLITYDKIVIKYMSTGFDTITLKLYSPCLVQPLVITKVIRILGPPTVDAGTYGTIDMRDGKIVAIPLIPGASTSINGLAPNDTLAYQWTELRGSVVDKSDSYNEASFKPRTLTNVVQLQVYHKALPYCAASDTAKVIIDLGIVIPNVFTPNNEGPIETEAWNILNLSSFYPNATLQIFNKWGALLREFRGGDYSIGWEGTRNGQDMPVATYYYILDLKNGIVHTGSVTLLR